MWTLLKNMELISHRSYERTKRRRTDQSRLFQSSPPVEAAGTHSYSLFMPVEELTQISRL